MKISYNWLKEFVDIKTKPEKLAKDLSLFGHAVESIEKSGNDYILDFEIAANRGDCLSILGMAREICALYGLKLKMKNQRSKTQIKNENIDKTLKINISNSKICPRFTARVIDNIKITKSPKWMVDRLKSYGFRSLNNIVDITNYVMIETGQPLHAFDYDKIKTDRSGQERGFVQMNIRLAKSGESVITLDGKNQYLDKNSIIIENGKKNFDLAGIMGGYNSEVDKNTKTIVLQGAIFNPVLIRRTSKRLNHQTDASYRFERGVDYEGSVRGVNRSADLIKQSCPKSKIGQLIDIKTEIRKIRKIKINITKINKLLGTNLEKKQIIDYLHRLEFKTVKPINYLTNQLILQVPSYREFDVLIWQDIAEEIARIYGYNNLGQNHFAKEHSKEDQKFILKKHLKDILYKNGFVECYSYSFADEKLIKILGYKLTDCQEVINSITPENKYLRPSLLTSLLTVVAKNPWAPEINIFEIGKVFQKRRLTLTNTQIDAEETWQLGIITTQKNAQNIKSVLNDLNLKIDIKSPEQQVLDYLKIRKHVKYVVIDFDKIKIKAKNYLTQISNIKYQKISEFPPTIRDLAFIVDKKINAEKVRNSISNLNSHILLVDLFDEFSSNKFGKNKKNIAYHVWLQNMKNPMNAQEVDKITQKIVNKIEQKFKAKLRS